MSMISLAYQIDEQEFRSIIANSSSCAEAMRNMGFKCTTGGSHVTVKRRIEELQINTDHWLDNTRNAHIANRIPNEEYFVANQVRNNTNTKKRIVEDNLIEYRCACCGNLGEWNGRPLVLQLDHINGDNSDNRLENLRFLCPNCHSQTDTFAGKNLKK